MGFAGIASVEDLRNEAESFVSNIAAGCIIIMDSASLFSFTLYACSTILTGFMV